jgi:RHS repeat-associated protein
MIIRRETMGYQYDALDRLVVCSQSEQATAQRFYLVNRLVTEIQGSVQSSLFLYEGQLMAQLQGATIKRCLFATDHQCSVLNAMEVLQCQPFAYTPYGHCSLIRGGPSLIGFNGQRADSLSGHYLLGNGYRAFNPMLMRFNSPDGWSPFKNGGLNAYSYCLGDPVNREDSSGQSSRLIRFLNRVTRRATQIVSGKPNVGTKVRAKSTTRVAPETFVFDSFYENKRQLNIVTHNYSQTRAGDGGMHLNSPGYGMAWTPEEFVANLNEVGVINPDHKRINIMTCYGADGGDISFAQQVANLTNIRTKSYFGETSFGSLSVGEDMQWIRANRDSKSAGVAGYKYRSAIFKPAQPRR